VQESLTPANCRQLPVLPAEQCPAEESPTDLGSYLQVIRLTRTWVQYGIFGFAVFCILVGAVEAMFGR